MCLIFQFNARSLAKSPTIGPLPVEALTDETDPADRHGAGDPEQITLQAVAALNRAEVIFILDKGYVDDQLLRLRKELCQRFITHERYRLVQVQDPRREDDPQAYERGIEGWHEQRAILFERLLTDELGVDQVGAFLVWGDPSLYDSTMRILDQVLARGKEVFEYQVIPGITSVQSLVARHRIPLNRIGESILSPPADAWRQLRCSSPATSW